MPNKNVPVGKTQSEPKWKLILYISRHTPASDQAQANLLKLCEKYVPNQFSLEVVDIHDPEQEIPLDILAVPTVVRISPPPERRVLGDLSNRDRAVQGLGFKKP
jgi:circadian clock protein KaiB